LSLKEYAFKVLKLPLFVAIVDPPNRASIRVAEKLGMRYEGIRNAHELANRYPELEVAYYILEN
ncbi:MAG: GNAT family N-acetyltransferase, partial [Gammaproteobacteria bacterium]|nr:GNAT family N-acetyltransferase [Gammaproteobacteria bacterium]